MTNHHHSVILTTRTTAFITICFILLSVFSCKPKQATTKEVDNAEIIEDENKANANKTVSKSDKKYILFFGNSLTAGYGLDENESFPALIQQRLDSLNLPYIAINGGLSGETTSGGNNRIEWVLKQRVDVFVLELGANDVLRGLDLTQTETNLRAILTKVKVSNPKVKLVLAGMQAPPNMGNEYTKRFSAIYPRLAKEFNAALIPFLLDHVATISSLNLEDGKHPNAAGQYIVRENVWRIMKDIL